VKELLVFLLVWVGPAIIVLLIGGWAILRNRIGRRQRAASREPQPPETESHDRKAA
jgi:cytochrome c-type biogenesis protein CcmH/NrfF